MVNKILICILCGGSGSRLYPLSTKHIPKQFISLGEKGTLLQETIRRAYLINDKLKEQNHIVHDIMLMMNKNHQLPDELKQYETNIIYEDYANDTAVAILRAVIASQKYGDINLLILPADHYINHVDQFVFDIVEGTKLLKQDNIVLYGITPTSPDTKYGYILDINNQIIFKEKPNYETAVSLLSQNAVWNAGIFLASNQLLYQLLSPMMDWIEHPRIGKADSFDITVLQQFSNIQLYQSQEWGWSDVGSWQSLTEIDEIKKDLYHYISDECQNVKIINKTKMNIMTIGCHDLYIVAHDDNILIMSSQQDYNNNLKNIVQKYNL
jgi:mannose-1-phosphate guanylyltransferase